MKSHWLSDRDSSVGCWQGRGLLGLCLLWAVAGAAQERGSAANAGPQRSSAPLAWPAIGSEQRPWTWWWWHGSAVDETNLSHELQRFHDAGLGGVQITTIYGVNGAESRDIPYLTPRWLEMMGYTVNEARRLGMGVDMSLGSGWCFGGPTVSDQDANAGVVMRTFTVQAGEKLAERFDRKITQALMAFSVDGNNIELADKISGGGGVDWTAPAGTWKVYAISQRPSGQKVKRAGPGGEGWMLNPLYPQAVRDWLPWFDAAFAKYSGPKPHAVFQDSYEYRTDWAPDFFAQFEKLRGYKLQTELPALFGNAQDDHTARVKYDYRLTVSEIMAQQSEPIWIDWAHKNGLVATYQAHGTPGNWLDLYGDADIPETEMFHNDRNVLISKFASSAAHTQGRDLVGAETGTWVKEHFTETLADLKYLADDMFLAGVNHILYHGTCYSPDDAPWPGWLFYASTEMNPRNSTWHDVPALNEYIARCQAVLQSGKPDNDVLLYWPVADFWSSPSGRLQTMTVSQAAWFEGQPIGKTAHELWNRGYAFDYVSDQQLQGAKVADGKIRMPGGDYRVVVIPATQYMPVGTLQKLIALAQKGATLVFEGQLPGDVPGWHELDVQRAEFKKSLADVKLDATSRRATFVNSEFWKFSQPGGPKAGHAAIAYSAGLGLVLVGDGAAALEGGKIPSEPMFQRYPGLKCVRRAFDGGWYYFIVNRGETNVDGWFQLGRPSKSVAILDPITGNSGVATPNLGGQIHLQLAAGASLILRSLADKTSEGPAWKYWQADGQPFEIAGEWQVSFIQGGPTLPADSQLTKLASWTTLADTNVQSFAGTATYDITFDAPARANATYSLDLGKVCQSARVRLNGKDMGTLITPPFRVLVTDLKPTGNKLEVEVTSVAANRIRDLDRRGAKWKIFKDINFVNVDYRPFSAANWPLTDCGLLGPVTLAAVTPQQ